MHPCFPEYIVEIILVNIIRKFAGTPCQPFVSRCPSMADRAVVYSEHACDQRCAGRQAWRIRAVIIIEPDAFSRNPVNIRSRVAVIAVAAHMVRPERININEQYSQIAALPFMVKCLYQFIIKIGKGTGTMPKSEGILARYLSLCQKFKNKVK
jgi:hypothetical protein